MKKYFKNGQAYLVIAFVMMGVLFFSSSQTYTQQSQVSLLSKLLANEPFKEQLSQIKFLYAGGPVSIEASGYFKFVEFFIRKGAHFLSYFILGGSFFLGLQPRLKQLGLSSLFAWLAATGYAGLDEFHQLMTGGRSALIEDVALDSLGALTAIILLVSVSLVKRLRK